MSKGTTPGRRSVIRLDTPTSRLQQPAWTQDLQFQKISSATRAPVDMVHHRDIGWRLEEYQSTLSVVHEQDTADDAVYPLTVAGSGGSGLFQKNAQRNSSDLTGVDVSGQRVSGDHFHTKLIADGDSWVQVLAADEAAYPSPSTSPIVPLDRVANIGGTNHRPDESIWLRFDMPSTAIRTVGEIGRIYFSGLAGQLLNESPGLGQYCFSWYGDGSAVLREKRQDGVWSIRRKMLWCPPNQVMGTGHTIVIRSDARLDPDTGLWKGSKIVFQFNNLANPVAAVIQTFIDLLDPQYQTYTVPQAETNQPTIEQIRIDIRQDVKARIQIAKSKYKPTGTLYTRSQSLPFLPFAVDENPVYVTLYGGVPVGTSVSIRLFNEDTNTECTASGAATTDSKTYYQQGFTLVEGKGRYYAEITENASSDQFSTPTTRRVTFFRPAVSKTYDATPTLVKKVLAVSLSGPEADPTHETMQFTAADLDGHLDLLKSRSGMTIRQDVYGVDPLDPTVYSIAFSGYVIKAKRRQRTGKVRQGRDNPTAPAYPVARWGSYEVVSVGQWRKLMQQKAPERFNFADIDGTDDKAPYKISTLLRYLFQKAGYLDQQIDVPDDPRRFQTKDDQSGMVIEPFTELGPLIVRMAREWLGAFIVWDANATNGGSADDEYGCWRVIIPPSPPYTVLANFWHAPQVANVPVISPAAYPTVDGIQATFIKWGTLHDFPEPAEGSYVVVDGAGDPGGVTSSNAGDPVCLRRVLFNWPAADFGQDGVTHPAVDPTHPDYAEGEPVGIYYSDPMLNKQEAVDIMARRIFDQSCHTKKWVQFEAPLLFVTNPDDDKQIRPRMLRFGDIVNINGETFVVNTVNPKWSSGQDNFMHAAYECFNAPAVTKTEDSPEGFIDTLFRLILGADSSTR